MTATRPATLADYSKALDEIYALRRAIAYEATRLEDAVALKSYPRSGRGVVQYFVNEMRGYARGLSQGRERLMITDERMRWAREQMASEHVPRDLAGWLSGLAVGPAHLLERYPAPEELATLAWPELLRLRIGAMTFSAAIEYQLRFKTLPASKRQGLELSEARLWRSGLGSVHTAYRGVNRGDMDEAIRAAGASDGLTRSSFEAERAA
jgi:hypothetical protein